MASLRSYRTPRDPWASEAGEADPFGLFAFFATLLVFAAVGGAVYSGLLFSPGTIAMPDLFGARAEQTALRLSETVLPPKGVPMNPPRVVATATAQPVVSIQPTAQPAAPAAAQPVVEAKPTLYVPPVAQPQVQVQAQPTVQPTATAVATRYKVANTHGDGVFIRRTPRLTDRVVAWPENTAMEFAGEIVDGEGGKWAKVKDPRGTVGWVPVQYLAPAQ